MSGGRWAYIQYRFNDITSDIETLIERNGREKTAEEKKMENWHDPDWYEKYPEEKYFTKYSEATIAKFKEAARVLREAEVYANRLDWLLSGDDGEEAFLSRLDKDLAKLDKGEEYCGCKKRS